jgi:hypothetical protein
VHRPCVEPLPSQGSAAPAPRPLFPLVLPGVHNAGTWQRAQTTVAAPGGRGRPRRCQRHAIEVTLLLLALSHNAGRQPQCSAGTAGGQQHNRGRAQPQAVCRCYAPCCHVTVTPTQDLQLQVGLRLRCWLGSCMGAQVPPANWRPGSRVTGSLLRAQDAAGASNCAPAVRRAPGIARSSRPSPRHALCLLQSWCCKAWAVHNVSTWQRAHTPRSALVGRRRATRCQRAAVEATVLQVAPSNNAGRQPQCCAGTAGGQQHNRGRARSQAVYRCYAPCSSLTITPTKVLQHQIGLRLSCLLGSCM